MVNVFQLVPQIHYGVGAATLAGTVLRDQGVTRVLFVCDPAVLAAGVCEPVLESIHVAGIAIDLYDDLKTNPSDQHVAAATTRYVEADCDGLIGVGGGSAMDVAKCVATVMSNGGVINDYEDGARPGGKPPPLVLVPTTAGTGSEVVSGAIITDTRRTFKMHIVGVPAVAALCDPTLTLTLPPAVTAAAGIDALAHAIGAYVSSERQPLADAMALYAISAISRWLPVAFRDGADVQAREQMMIASMTAGISMKGGGAVDHAFAHAVNAIFDVHHGVGVAMFLAAGMEFNAPYLPDRFADVSRALLPDVSTPDAAAGIDRVRELIHECKLPGPGEFGITRAAVPDLVEKVMADRFHLGLNPVEVTKADASDVLMAVIA